ncbi:MAG: hypothetical protein QXU47_01775 [Candidatus Bathyarchaeia archaeon]
MDVMYTGRESFLTSATGHRLKDEVAIVREMTVEGETLDYEKVLVMEFTRQSKGL